jgi:hypothetical protein
MNPWSHTIRLSELAHGPVSAKLEPDAATRAQIAKLLGLESLPALSAQFTVTEWLDGAEVKGRFTATVGQICSVSADSFEEEVEGEIDLTAVPAGSPSAPVEPEGGEIELSLDAPDPPDVLEGDELDLGAYLVEHLELALDPFPRKPGAVFDYTPDEPIESPFAALKRLKDDGA